MDYPGPFGEEVVAGFLDLTQRRRGAEAQRGGGDYEQEQD